MKYIKYIFICLQYLQEFKALMSHLPDLRAKLESAARAKQSVDNTKAGVTGNASEMKTFPSIKLKTDFSNFS